MLRVLNLRRHTFPRLAAVVAFVALTVPTGVVVTAESADTREAVVSVKGMMCSMCARGLETRLSKLGDAKAAKVNLDEEQAIVTFPAKAKPVKVEPVAGSNTGSSTPQTSRGVRQ